MTHDTNELVKFLRRIRDRYKRDFDTVILITAKERTGKSTLAFWLGRLIHGESWSHEQMVFAGKDFIELAKTAPKGTVIVLDEAIHGGFSRDAMGKQNKELVKFLVICGERNLIAVICWPNINYLERYIREHRMHYWFLVKKRGTCEVREPLPTDFYGAKPASDLLFSFDYPAVPKSDPVWKAYLAEKSGMVDRYESDEERESSRVEAGKDGLQLSPEQIASIRAIWS